MFAWVVSLFVPSINEGNVAIINIKGIISYSQEGIGESTANVDDIIENIDDAMSNDAKGIIFLINSPGGTVVATDELANKIKTLDVPTVAVIRDIGTSGAYWVASSTDYIFSNPMSLTASIGATSSYLSFEGTLEDFNVSYNRIVSGKFKDIGTPFKKLTLEEKEKLKSMINQVGEYFVEQVALNRNLTIEEVRKIATGEPILGKRAYAIGLVDALGNLNDAKEYLRDKLNTTIKTYEYKVNSNILNKLFSLSAFRYGINNNLGIRVD